MKANINIETKSIADLENSIAKYNPRVITGKARMGLYSSIQKLGYIDPIIFNKRTNTIVSGHQRLSIMKEQGYTEIDVSIIDVPEDIEKKINVTMNNQLITGDYTQSLDELIEEFDIDFLDSTYISELLTVLENEEDDSEIITEEKQKYPKMELLPYESYDCILIITETKNDFNLLKEKLGIKKVNGSTSFEGKTKIGETRAVKGSVLVKLLTKEDDEIKL